MPLWSLSRWRIGLITLLFYLLLIGVLIGINYWQEDWLNITIREFSIRGFPVLVLLLVIHFIASFRKIGEKELGAILFFGKPLVGVDSGPTFVPRGICELATETRLVVQQQFPGEPEDIDRSGDDKKPELGKKLPMRITTAKKEAEAGKEDPDPLTNRLTVEPSVVVRFKINNFITFLQTIGSIDKVEEQLRDMIESTLRSQFGVLAPAEIIKTFENVNAGLLGATEDRVKDWGINVLSVRLVEFDITKTINEALRDQTAAKIQRDVTVTKADAEQKRLTLEGQGRGNARKAELEGEAAGLAAISNTLKSPEGKIAALVEVGGEALATSEHTIITDTGDGGVLGSLLKILTAGTRVAFQQVPRPASSPPSSTPPKPASLFRRKKTRRSKRGGGL